MDKIVQKSSLIFLFIGVLFGGFIGLNASAYAEKPKQETQINNTGCSRWIVEGYYKNIYRASTKYVVFKTVAFDHSASPPKHYLIIITWIFIFATKK